MFSGFGLKPPTSGFQSVFTVASRLLHLYSTDDKTSRLKMKSFSTLRDTQRGSILQIPSCFFWSSTEQLILKLPPLSTFCLNERFLICHLKDRNVLV